jgi:hypothetical protein
MSSSPKNLFLEVAYDEQNQPRRISWLLCHTDPARLQNLLSKEDYHVHARDQHRAQGYHLDFVLGRLQSICKHHTQVTIIGNDVHKIKAVLHLRGNWIEIKTHAQEKAKWHFPHYTDLVEYVRNRSNAHGRKLDFGSHYPDLLQDLRTDLRVHATKRIYESDIAVTDKPYISLKQPIDSQRQTMSDKLGLEATVINIQYARQVKVQVRDEAGYWSDLSSVFSGVQLRATLPLPNYKEYRFRITATTLAGNAELEFVVERKEPKPQILRQKPMTDLLRLSSSHFEVLAKIFHVSERSKVRLEVKDGGSWRSLPFEYDNGNLRAFVVHDGRSKRYRIRAENTSGRAVDEFGVKEEEVVVWPPEPEPKPPVVKTQSPPTPQPEPSIMLFFSSPVKTVLWFFHVEARIKHANSVSLQRFEGGNWEDVQYRLIGSVLRGNVRLRKGSSRYRIVARNAVGTAEKHFEIYRWKSIWEFLHSDLKNAIMAVVFTFLAVVLLASFIAIIGVAFIGTRESWLPYWQTFMAWLGWAK